MPHKAIDVYFGTQMCLVYTGQLEGKVGDKRILYKGRLAKLPKLRRSKRYCLRIRGRDPEGNRVEPLMCHARTDGAGDLIIQDKYKPVIEKPPNPDAEVPIPVMPRPRPSRIALSVNKHLRGTP